MQQLPDVYDTIECHCPDHGVTAASKERRVRSKLCMYRFNHSEWFTRGWCLQELLAPPMVLFFNARFQWIGSKLDLSSHISTITGIDVDYLKDPDRIQEASVAERMRWASQRQTTREEDIAYSLLGIFDVNMPLLYGEGPKAFLRLQSEIIKKSDDESIFVWWIPLPKWTGLLAPNPSAFCMESIEPSEYEYRRHFEMTNKGIHFTIHIPESHSALSRSPRETTKMIFPLNVEQVTDAGSRTEMTRRAAIKLVAVPNQSDRLLMAERVIGDNPEVGIILAREDQCASESSKRIEHVYDENDSMHDFGNLYDIKHDEAVYVVKNIQDAGKEWQVYIPQDGM